MTPTRSRIELEQQVAIALLIAVAVSTVIIHFDVWMVDFASYYFAADLLLQGHGVEIYGSDVQMIVTAEMPAIWDQRMAAHGIEGEDVYPFIYPPWFAYLFTVFPLVFTPQQGMVAATVANTAMLLLLARIGWRATGSDLMRWSQWALLFAVMSVSTVALTFAVHQGQIQIAITLLCVLALERDRSGHPVAAGVALALAACIKITPAAFALVFLLDRNWKALGAFMLTCALILGLSLAVIGLPMHLAFLDRVREIEHHMVISPVGLSFESILYQISTIFHDTTHAYTHEQLMLEKPRWIALTVKAVLLLSIAAVVLMWRRTGGGADAKLRAWIMLAIALPFLGPLAWSHYFLMIVFLLPGFVTLFGRRTGFWLIAVFLVTFSSAAHLLLIPNGGPVFPQPFIAALFLVPAFLAVSGLLRPGRPAPGEADLHAPQTA